MNVSEATELAPQPSLDNLLSVAQSPRRPRVLVLLAAYNGLQWIRQQLDSILSQDGVDLRITVRDDGSTDATTAAVEEFRKDERVELHTTVTPSGSAAENFFTLIRENPALDVDFVAFADQDDTWNADKLIRACRTLISESSAGYSSATTAAWPDGRASILTQSSIPGTSDFLFEGAGQGCTFVLTTDFYHRVRNFLRGHSDLTCRLHYHDWSMYALARAWDLRWSFDPKPSMIYRQHAANDTGARHTLGGIRKRLKLIREGWYRNQLRAIAALCLAAAPDNAVVAAWHALFNRPDTWSRRLQILRFCLHGGRRRRLDNTILLFATVAGWI